MESLQRYDGNVHPELWVKQAKAFCLLNKIHKVPLQLQFCIEMTSTTIKIPNGISTFDELINALKEDISFTVFKDTCKRKLQSLKYVCKGGDTSKFLAEFRMLCFGAEINNIEELKQYLFQSIQSYYHIDYDDYNNVSSMGELFRLFNDVASSNINVIRTGSIVKLKHIASGKYLSCRYKVGPTGYEMVCIKFYTVYFFTLYNN